MAKVLIYSDIHIHAHKKNADRIEDCLEVLDWVYKVAERNSIKHVLFLGDLFHERQKIDVLTYQKTFEKLVEAHASGSFTTFLLLGNHDMYYFDKWDINSIAPLNIIPNIKVIAKPSSIQIEDFTIDLLPYTHNPLGHLAQLSKNSKRVFLGAHISVDGAKLNSYGTEADVIVEHDGAMVKVDKTVFENWENVFLGHYHCPQQLSENIEYIGSPLELNFGEAFQEKHICIFDLKTKEKKYIVNEFSPKHLIIKESQIANYNLSNNFVRIVSEDITCTDTIDMYKNLQTDKSIKSIELKNSNVKMEEQSHAIKDASAILLNEDMMIENYIKDQSEQEESPIKDLNKKLLLKIGKMICEEANVL